MKQTNIWFPNTLVVVSNSQPIYSGQAFTAIVGYIDNTGAFTRLTLGGNLTYRIITPEVTDNGNLVFVPQNVGSFSIAFRYSNGSVKLHTIANFYAVLPIPRVNYSNLYTVLKQELPSSYFNGVSADSGNYLDNYATCKTWEYIYSILYGIIDSQYPANGYNTNWEFALNGTNYLFQKAAYPELINNLLYQVPFVTGVNRFDLTKFIARYCYYWTGSPVTVYIDGDSNIIIYAPNQNITWTLGDPVLSKLGETTYLGSINYNLFGFFLQKFLLRYFPVQIKWTLTFSGSDPLMILDYVGYTYFGDIRPVVAMSYTGDNNYPFNLNGYTLL